MTEVCVVSPLRPDVYVDDITQTAAGQWGEVATQLIDGGLALVKRMLGSMLKMSGKSVVVASSVKAAKAIVQALGEHGVSIRLARSARDLGGCFLPWEAQLLTAWQ